MSKTGYSRVYAKYGSYYFVDLARKWHRLCRVSEGEPAMLRALARIKDRDAYAPESMPGLIDLAYLTGLRMGDLRRLTWRQIDDDVGIEVEPAKTQHSTGAKILIPITPAIKQVLERARAIGKVKGTTVIHSLAGGQYSKDG